MIKCLCLNVLRMLVKNIGGVVLLKVIINNRVDV